MSGTANESNGLISGAAAELLAAGAILPPGTADAGERAVPLTARTYRHPGLDERVVVRLVPDELGPAEDAAAGFLGLEPEGEPTVVGLGPRQALGFPEWVLVHYPADGHHALGVVPELERAARQAKSKPKLALDTYQEIAGRLAAAVPHFLPTFYEQAGRVFLSVENATYAAQMFTKARAAEAQHGLSVDEDRLDAVFLEFALAGALPVKVLAGYGKELAARLPAAQALERFVRLCVRRTAGGLPPSAQMAVELRKLAKGAGVNADTAEQDYLAELLGLPSTLRAPAGWWKAHRSALIALAKRAPAVRRALLDTMPTNNDAEIPAVWLDLLVESGTTDVLHRADATDEERPADGTAGWLRRFQKVRQSAGWWSKRHPLPALYRLVDACADRLRAELTQNTATGDKPAPLDVPDDVNLLDLFLALGLPVADPAESTWLSLEQWSEGEGQRDLLALAADPRFLPAFIRGADRFSNDEDGRRTLGTLTDSPGGRPMLAAWVRELTRRFSASGLPGLPQKLGWMSWLPGPVLALAEPEVRAALGTDLAPVLARTLRAGLFDELVWPAWEEAVAHLVARDKVRELVVADAWPHLIVAGETQARVIGPDGTALVHDLRIPANDRYSDPGYHYVDGELFVTWLSRSADNGLRGYWHGSADRVQAVESGERYSTRSTKMNWYHGLASSLPLPGGGRTTGAGVVHRGDTAVPPDRQVIGDGTSYWVWHRDNDERANSGWYEYEPVSGQLGRRSMPGHLSDVLAAAPPGSEFQSGWVLPTDAAEATPAARPVNGTYGWCVVKLPDGSWRGQDPSGLTVAVPKGVTRPIRALMLPGAQRPSALVSGHYNIEIVDADGVVTSTGRIDHGPGVFGEGTAILPPVPFWHCLVPRDPQGSLALRGIDLDTTAALLEAGAAQRTVEAAQYRLPALVGELLPQVTHEALLAGIAGVVRFAANQQATLDEAAARLEEALAGGSQQDTGPNGPTDKLLFEPLNDLGAVTNNYWRSRQNAVGDATFRQLWLIGEAVRGVAESASEDGAGSAASSTAATAPLERLHLDGAPLPSPAAAWWQALSDGGEALAYRAVSLATSAEERDGLRELLRQYEAAGLACPAQSSDWRLLTLFVSEKHLTNADGRDRSGSWQALLPLDGDRLLAVISSTWADSGTDFIALYHDPSGRFEVPAPYQRRSSVAIGGQRGADWFAGFQAEWDARGPVPWFPETAEEFSRLTGVTSTEARLVLAGLPGVEQHERNFLSAETRTTLGVKAADAALARDRLRRIEVAHRRAVLAALQPEEPARLWTHGPDVEAAAEAWNRLVGRRTAVPEALFGEAVRAVKTGWEPSLSLPAVVDPAAAPDLTVDLKWKVERDRVQQVDNKAVGFTERAFVGALAMAAWLAYRLPAGDPIRAGLPATLAAVRARLASPDLMLSLGSYADLPAFRKLAGAPTEVGTGYERYGAIILATHDDQPVPAVLPPLLDAAGGDAFLPALRPRDEHVPAIEVALRLVRDARFEALLADPGDPMAGARGADGTWSPQDPTRSVPDLVGAVAKEHGLNEDAAALYLMLLTLPDPTDRNVARWTGWRPARLKAAQAELAGSELVVQATRARAGRSLFLPGGWNELRSPHLPLEQWKLPLLTTLLPTATPVFGVVVPGEPVESLYRRAWQRVLDGDGPRFAELKVGRARRR